MPPLFQAFRHSAKIQWLTFIGAIARDNGGQYPQWASFMLYRTAGVVTLDSHTLDPTWRGEGGIRIKSRSYFEFKSRSMSQHSAKEFIAFDLSTSFLFVLVCL